MKTKISRLSPHQNGKVFDVMLAVTTLIVGVLFTLMFFVGPGTDDEGKKAVWELTLFVPYIFALVYFVFDYFFALLASTVYNFFIISQRTTSFLTRLSVTNGKL